MKRVAKRVQRYQHFDTRLRGRRRGVALRVPFVAVALQSLVDALLLITIIIVMIIVIVLTPGALLRRADRIG